MKINPATTQLLCLYGGNDVDVRSYIDVDGSHFFSEESLKIVGLHFGAKPNIFFHFNKMRSKFYQQLWSLRHLKRARLKKKHNPWSLISVFVFQDLQVHSDDGFVHRLSF